MDINSLGAAALIGLRTYGPSVVFGGAVYLVANRIFKGFKAIAFVASAGLMLYTFTRIRPKVLASAATLPENQFTLLLALMTSLCLMLILLRSRKRRGGTGGEI